MSSLLLLLAGAPLAVLAHSGHHHEHHQRAGSALERRADVALTEIYPGMNFTVLPVPVNAAGSVPPGLANCPPLPEWTFTLGVYPMQDHVPAIDTPEVLGWLSKIDFSTVPSYQPNLNSTGDGLCVANPAASTDAANRKWWSCGQHIGANDIEGCAAAKTWGLSYDDGPSDYSQALIEYLGSKSLKATYYIIGSRALERPNVIREQHMLGHELAAHTWSHPALTTLTNEQIVAELGWARKVIYDISGVTVRTFRPPQGDIDDRVREIARQMDLQPSLWSSVTGTQNEFDTQDWRVQANQTNATAAYNDWINLLNSEPVAAMTTGFISLEHDAFPTEVDLAVQYFLPDALTRNLNLTTVHACVGKQLSESYAETATESTATSSSGTSNSTTGGTSTSSSSNTTSSSTTTPASGGDRTTKKGGLTLVGALAAGLMILGFFA
ncbi:hypothetical protein BDY24DRAFT_392090 [Mrakia frigida]|uniref:uncharacterized protein n=1 Tax=Mrakia frigida TaxID=29902 RepID=UPI003FCC1B2E